MLRILAFALGVVAIGGLLIWFADRASRPVMTSVRLGGALAAALIAWIVYALASSDDAVPVAALVGGGALLALAGYLVYHAIADRAVRPGRAYISLPATKSRLSKEWGPLLAALAWRNRSRASRAHDRIRLFVQAADRLGLGAEHQSLVIALKRRVPELLIEWQKCCVGATSAERDRYALRTLSILEQLASEADRARARLRDDGDRAFDSLERYFAGFTDKDDRSL